MGLPVFPITDKNNGAFARDAGAAVLQPNHLPQRYGGGHGKQRAVRIDDQGARLFPEGFLRSALAVDGDGDLQQEAFAAPPGRLWRSGVAGHGLRYDTPANVAKQVHGTEFGWVACGVDSARRDA